MPRRGLCDEEIALAISEDSEDGLDSDDSIEDPSYFLKEIPVGMTSVLALQRQTNRLLFLIQHAYLFLITQVKLNPL